MAKNSIIRVSSYTHQEIKTLSEELNCTQGEVVERALIIAKTNHFSQDDLYKKLNKELRENQSTLISFIKTQDKNMNKMEQNILRGISQKIAYDVMPFFSLFRAKFIETYKTKLLGNKNDFAMKNQTQKVNQLLTKSYEDTAKEFDLNKAIDRLETLEDIPNLLLLYIQLDMPSAFSKYKEVTLSQVISVATSIIKERKKKLEQ